MSSKGSELLPLAFQVCRKVLSLLWENELLCSGEAELLSLRAVMADASDPEAALSDLKRQNEQPGQVLDARFAATLHMQQHSPHP